MRCKRPSIGCTGLLIASGWLAMNVGCQTVNTELAMLFGDVPASQVASPASPPGTDSPKFCVEIRESGHKPELVQLPLSDVVYIQQAIDQSGASRRFRRMKIELYRQLPAGGGHRLDVAFDRATHRVPPGADYAVHPNDRIVVIEDTSTIVDEMLESLGGPFGKAIGG